MYTHQKVSTFQDRFATLFDESEKTVMELAKELHVSYQTVSAWKVGTRSPKLPTVISIAKYFHVRFQWLMGFDVEKEEKEEPKDAIVIESMEQFSSLLRYMTPEDYEYVVRAFNKARDKMREAGKEL